MAIGRVDVKVTEGGAQTTPEVPASTVRLDVTDGDLKKHVRRNERKS